MRIYEQPGPSDNDMVLTDDGWIMNAYHGERSPGCCPKRFGFVDSDALAVNSTERIAVDLWQFDAGRGLSYRERALPTPEEIAGVGR